MRKLIVSEFVSIDGVMEAPGGEPGYAHSGWVGDFYSPQWEQYKLTEVLEAETLLIGRTTYESFAGAWPHRQGEFADKMNAMPKLVVSTTMKRPAWRNSTVLNDNIAAQIEEIKRANGGPILVAGSRTLVRLLFANDLVDELRLMIFPLILGSGHRIFPDRPEKLVLRLTGTLRFDNGVIVNTYER